MTRAQDESVFVEFAAEIDNVQKDIFKSLRASWEEAGDAFRTEGEVSRRGMEEAGKDYLLGLAETFKLEGTSIGTEWKELFGGIKLPNIPNWNPFLQKYTF